MSAAERIDEPTAYYVTIVQGRRKSLAAGPYDTHEDALAAIDRIREQVERLDSWAHFYGFGTAGFHGPREQAPLGKLNRLGVVA